MQRPTAAGQPLRHGQFHTHRQVAGTHQVSRGRGQVDLSHDHAVHPKGDQTFLGPVS